MNWDHYFISLLEPIAQKSKDPRTKVSCVIVGQDNEIKSTGFNGFPIGVSDAPERYENREIKYKFVSHAESNAIAFAARNGISLKNSKIYVGFFPCSNCAKLIIQSGIKEVIIDGKDLEQKMEHWKSWLEDIKFSETMLSEAKVAIRIYKDTN